MTQVALFSISRKLGTSTINNFESIILFCFLIEDNFLKITKPFADFVFNIIVKLVARISFDSNGDKSIPTQPPYYK